MATELILFIIHLIICLILFLLMQFHILRCGKSLWLAALLIPVFGLIAVFIMEINERRKNKIGSDLGLEKLLIEDEVFKSILIDEDVVHHEVVPLQEALLMNDPKIRRDLLMDILYANPGDYVDQLHEASLNDDTEVVHYAVTALVELQKGFDLKFQDLEERMKKDPDNGDLLDEYQHLLEDYLGSKLLQGNDLNVQLYTYRNLLQKRIDDGDKSFPVYSRKIDADLRLKEYDKVLEDIEYMIWRWPLEEKGYLYLIQYYVAKRDTQKIKETIKKMKDMQIHISKEGKMILEFWEQDRS